MMTAITIKRVIAIPILLKVSHLLRLNMYPLIKLSEKYETFKKEKTGKRPHFGYLILAGADRIIEKP